MFPLANEVEKENGWTLSLGFIRKVMDAVEPVEGWIPEETIESILLAAMEYTNDSVS